MHTTKLLMAIAMVAVTITPGSAQSDSKAAFEVASIKPAAPAGMGVRIQIAPGGRFTASNVNVKFLIQEAYSVKDFQITGGPGWMSSERYDVTAKAEGDGQVTPDQVKAMLRSLLEERFKFTFHRETKELPIYALVVGKNGSKLQESTAGGGGGGRGMVRMGRGSIDAKGADTTMIANQLGQRLGRNVIDKTGLKGQYDFKLEWTPDEQSAGPNHGGPEGQPPPVSEGTGPSLVTAVQEQLGLKLESQKGPVEILIVDKVEKATEN